MQIVPCSKYESRIGLLTVVLLLGSSCFAVAQSQIGTKPAELKTDWGNQGDGTFVNPILPGDFSDVDAIRVGDVYYAISSTFQFSPGVIILQSRDLVSWTIVGHAVDDITQISPRLNWDRMDHYGRGVWAGAIRFHAGRYWIYFGTPDEGFFMTTAPHPAGPWEPLHQVWKVQGWDDGCPFWDDDGQGYFVCTNFADGYKVHLFKLSADGKQLDLASGKVIYQARGSEANKLYKFDGRFYHYFSEVKPEGRVAMMERSQRLDGPWELRQLQHVQKTRDREPNQGAFLQAPSGEWWFLTHQGTTGHWEGRTMALLPVEWSDGWPIIGNLGADGIGNMVWSAGLPIAGKKIEVPQTSDDFATPRLAPQWEWNYQPRPEKWSLAERPGFLRLHAFPPLRPGQLKAAGNTLTQRALRTATSEAIVQLEIGGMTDGQHSGLCHFGDTHASLGVRQDGNTRILVRGQGDRLRDGAIITAPTIWLRSRWDERGSSRFSYSLDGNHFKPVNDEYQLTWGDYRGDRVGIFNYNDRAESGFVDVASFRYHFTLPKGAAKL